MKKNIIAKLSRKAGRAKFTLQKHAPQILVVAGIGGVIVSTVQACKATTKLSKLLDDQKEQIDTTNAYVEERGYTEEYSENDYKKDIAILYRDTVVGLVKLYGPSFVLGMTSIGCIVTSNRILSKRNIALTAAYATVESGYKKYRERVIERFGKKVDHELTLGSVLKDVDVVKTDSDGNETTTRETRKVVTDPIESSMYARFFQEFTFDHKGNTIPNHYWYPDNEKNFMFLKNVERFANDKLRTNGIVFLNEVYEMLGLPRSQAGQVVGWVYDESNPDIDNHISFGLYDDPNTINNYLYYNEDAILVDFNVDGNVWEQMRYLGVNSKGSGNPARDEFDYSHLAGGKS